MNEYYYYYKMDRLTQYVFEKNMNTPDKFHDHIELTDIFIVQNAAMWIVVAPIGTFALLYALRNYRTYTQKTYEVLIDKTMSKFPKGAQAATEDTKWASKKASPESEEVQKGSSDDLKTIYQNVKSDRQNMRNIEVEKVKEKLQEQIKEVKATNIITSETLDPFERKRRLVEKQLRQQNS
jgi:hypothetical protein